MQHLLLVLFIVGVAGQDSKPCITTAACAVNKCLDKSAVSSLIRGKAKSEVFAPLVEKFDMVCIAAKCGAECRQCKQCQYALDQMAALANGEKTSGMCPKLEGCVERCLKADINKAVKCVAHDCNVHCYDGDCPSCRAIAKRMFTQVCRENDMTNLPNIAFDGNCPLLFKELADLYVVQRSH